MILQSTPTPYRSMILPHEKQGLLMGVLGPQIKNERSHKSYIMLGKMETVWCNLAIIAQDKWLLQVKPENTNLFQKEPAEAGAVFNFCRKKLCTVALRKNFYPCLRYDFVIQYFPAI